MAEKTEEPTPKKLEDARKKGNVAQSRDLSSVGVYVVGVALLGTVTASTAHAFTALWRNSMTAIARGDSLLEFAPKALEQAQRDVLLAVAPLLAAAAVTGLALGFGQVFQHTPEFRFQPHARGMAHQPHGPGLKGIIGRVLASKDVTHVQPSSTAH